MINIEKNTYVLEQFIMITLIYVLIKRLLSLFSFWTGTFDNVIYEKITIYNIPI